MLFTGLREGEALALTFDCVSFVNGSITVNKQLQLVRGSKGQYRLVATKNSKVRTIHVAPYVLDILRDIRQEQERNRAIYGPPLEKIPYVFCTPMGEHYKPNTVYKNFKAVVRSLGYDHIRLHDLRHSYAVASIRSGDDIKTVQDNLGHATASFTLDVYGHVTDQMKRDSAARMEQFIQSVTK
jgi:integrase